MLSLSALEAILFAAGDPVFPMTLSEEFDLTEDEIENMANELNELYKERASGIQVIRIGGKIGLATRPEYEEEIRTALAKPKSAKLSNAALEVLAICAKCGEVTKAYIESVRGTDSSYTVNSLAEKGFLEEAGRLDVPGRPLTFRTTDRFLQVFGLENLDELEFD